jgi:acetyl esterase/lipase
VARAHQRIAAENEPENMMWCESPASEAGIQAKKSMRILTRTLLLAVCGLGVGTGMSTGQSRIGGAYERASNVPYLVRAGWEGVLDVYYRPDVSKPHPTVIYFHGGSSTLRGKTDVTLELQRYLSWGVNVVNVEWAVPGGTLLPVAIQNARCAIRWVAANAGKFKIDDRRLVTVGYSSGAAFAFVAAMMAEPIGPDLCPQPGDVKVAAVVRWAGGSDFVESLEGPNARPWGPDWFQGLPNPREIAKLLSPVAFIRPGAPPVISIHGDGDFVVPHSQAVRFHQALRDANVPEQLVIAAGKGHFDIWGDEQWNAVKSFLSARGLGPD